MTAAAPPPVVDGELPAVCAVSITPGADWTFCLRWYSDYGGIYDEPIPVDFTGATATLAIRAIPSAPSPILALSTTPSSAGSIVLSGALGGAGSALASSPASFTTTLAYDIGQLDLLIAWAGGAITEVARCPVLIAPAALLTQTLDIYQYADWETEWTWYGGGIGNPQPIDLTGCATLFRVRSSPTSVADLLDLTTATTDVGSVALGGSAGTVGPSLTASGVALLAPESVPFWEQFVTFPGGQVWSFGSGSMRVHPGNDY